MKGGRSNQPISRRETMRYARGFYPGRVRSHTKATPVGVIHYITNDGRVVGQGDSWATAYMNMRANLPMKSGQSTDWAALDSEVTR